MSYTPPIGTYPLIEVKKHILRYQLWRHCYIFLYLNSLCFILQTTHKKPIFPFQFKYRYRGKFINNRYFWNICVKLILGGGIQINFLSFFKISVAKCLFYKSYPRYPITGKHSWRSTTRSIRDFLRQNVPHHLRHYYQ